jgi:hypothetical protein
MFFQANLSSIEVWDHNLKVSHYFNTIFKDNYPAIYDSFIQNFSSTVIANTSVEGGFAISNNQVHINNSSETTKRKMGFYLDCRNHHGRKVKYEPTKRLREGEDNEDR